MRWNLSLGALAASSGFVSIIIAGVALPSEALGQALGWQVVLGGAAVILGRALVIVGEAAAPPPAPAVAHGGAN